MTKNIVSGDNSIKRSKKTANIYEIFKWKFENDGRFFQIGNLKILTRIFFFKKSFLNRKTVGCLSDQQRDIFSKRSGCWDTTEQLYNFFLNFETRKTNTIPPLPYRYRRCKITAVFNTIRKQQLQRLYLPMYIIIM